MTTTCRPLVGGVQAFAMTLLGLLGGFSRLTGAASLVKCEMVCPYLHYRVGVQWGIWWWLLLRFLVDVATTVANEFVWVAPDAPRRVSLRQVLAYALLERGVRPFLQTLVTVAIMTGTWHYCNVVYWDTAPWLARATLWGSLRDVFGICAAGGNAELWGYECIP